MIIKSIEYAKGVNTTRRVRDSARVVATTRVSDGLFFNDSGFLERIT